MPILTAPLNASRPAPVSPYVQGPSASGFFILRTSLLPFETLVRWVGDDLLSRAHTTDDVSRQRQQLVSRLHLLFERPDIREAMFIASPTAHTELLRVSANPSITTQKFEHALARYLARMAGRPTPYGLFAGCSLGLMSSRTNLALPSMQEYRRYSRLDTAVLCATARSLNEWPSVRASVTYTANASLVLLGSRWRYVRTSGTGRSNGYVSAALDSDVFLNAAIERARQGALISDLSECLMSVDDQGDISADEATAYVQQLIDCEVLVSSLAPVITATDPLGTLIQTLRDTESLLPVAETFETVKARLAALDDAPLGLAVDEYRAVEDLLGKVPANFGSAPIWQVELEKPSSNLTCGVHVVQEILRAVALLEHTCQGAPVDPLKTFREAFVARYERREVPLLEALNDECGVGVDGIPAASAGYAPLLADIPFPVGTDPSSTWTARDHVLLQLLQKCWSAGDYEIRLTDQDIKQLTGPRRFPLPGAFCAMVSLSAEHRADLTDGPLDNVRVLIRLHKVFGPSGVNLLGRFCPGNDDLTAWVKEHLAAEEAQAPDVLFAEVVHLPLDQRMGNIVTRPPFRSFEIPYLGKSARPASEQIEVSDLLVSIRDDQIILRSARLKRRVMPRMTTAHNFMRGEPVYRFLCSLQTQGLAAALMWTWGALASSSFLPRLSSGAVILSRARWNLDRWTIKSLTANSPNDQLTAIDGWRRRNRVPRFAVLSNDDHELPVDFENILSVETLLRELRGQHRSSIAEMLPGPDTSAAYGPEGHFAHEILLPFINRQPVRDAQASQLTQTSLPGRGCRRFGPYSDWLYAKIYAGAAAIDSLLLDVVRPGLRLYLSSGSIEKWFVVRYSDPHVHLRLRLLGRAPHLWREVFPDLCARLNGAVEEGRVWKWHLDTYDREVERYGGMEGIALAENLFWRDSEAMLALLPSLIGDGGADRRWRACLFAWDALLTNFGFSVATKQQIVSNMHVALKRELRCNKNTDRALGLTFRRERTSIDELLSGRLTADLEWLTTVVRERGLALESTISELCRIEANGDLALPLTQLAAHYLHMCANRLLRSQHHYHEFVLYDFLKRTYDSRIARQKITSSQA